MRAEARAQTAIIAIFLTAFLFAGAAQATPSGTGDLGQGPALQGDPAERAAERERLFTALANAKSEEEAQALVSEIWTLWFRAPNADASKLMSDAMERRSAHDYAAAVAILDKLVVLAPDWAEAWNQRATLRYLTEDYEGSLSDIEQVLALEPKHFGALAGQALILMRNGRFDTAQSVLKRAVAIDPFLAERALLVEPPKPAGKDI